MSLCPYLTTAGGDGRLLSGLTGPELRCTRGHKQTAGSLCPPASFCLKSSQITLPSKSPVWTAVWALSLVQSHGFLPSSHLSGALGFFNGGGKAGEGGQQPACQIQRLPACLSVPTFTAVSQLRSTSSKPRLPAGVPTEWRSVWVAAKVRLVSSSLAVVREREVTHFHAHSQSSFSSVMQKESQKCFFAGCVTY